MRSGEAFFVRVGALGAGLALALTAPATATTIEVETDVDEFGGGGTSACTLREAVEAARTNDSFGGCPAGSDKDRIKMPGSVVLQRPEAGGRNAGGDLDYNANEKLTIIGDSFFSNSMPEINVSPGFDGRILEATKGKVTMRGIQIDGVDSGEDSGGAVLATGARTSLTLVDVAFNDNSALSRGGAVSCEFCKSLDVRGIFRFNSNSLSGPETPLGGAIFSTAPTVIAGNKLPGPSGGAQINGNTATPGVDNEAHGGGIMAFGTDLTISNTEVSENSAGGEGAGGGIAMLEPSDSEPATLKLTGVTLDGNSAAGRGGAIDVGGFGTDESAGRLVANRIAVTDNDAVGTGGGLFTQADAKITESVFDSNQVFAPDGSSLAQGGGIFIDPGDATEVRELRVSRTSVTGNALNLGEEHQGAGIFASGTDLSLTNATLSANTGALPIGFGGGLFVQQEDGRGSAEIAFSTFRENVAGVGTNDGDAIVADFPDDSITIKASIIDESTDGCAVSPGTEIQSSGFNVQDEPDSACGFDAPTDSDGPDFLITLGQNGSPSVGVEPQPPFTPPTFPRTNAFTNDTSAALDIVPPNKCKVNGKLLKLDARGVPRPEFEGCDAGAVELTGCSQAFVVGSGSRIGTQKDDTIAFTPGTENVALALGGDDQVFSFDLSDFICGGRGDDALYPGDGGDVIEGGPGTDLLGYVSHPTPVTIDLGAGTATGAGNDFFGSMEDAMGGNAADTLLGSGGDNLLIGRDGADTLKGRGGIDFLDAKDGEADAVIDCGPGKNSKEKARVDVGLDPQPVSC